MTTEAMTVLGPVRASELGRTLPHEHIYIDLLPMVEELARHEPTPLFEEQLEPTNLGALRQNPHEYDLCGNSGFFTDGTNSWWLPSDRERCKGIAALVGAGYANSLLISQDIGHKHYLTEYGGWGYGHVLTDFKLMLEAFDVDASVHDTITRANPARMLTGEEEQRP